MAQQQVKQGQQTGAVSPPQSKHLSELSSYPANFCSSTGLLSLWLCLVL